MSIDVWGGGSSGGMFIPHNYSFSGLVVSAYGMNEKVYVVDVNPVVWVGRVYDKKMTLLQTVSDSTYKVRGISPSGYILQMSGNDTMNVMSLSGTLLFTVMSTWMGAYFSTLRGEGNGIQILGYDGSSLVTKIINNVGTVLATDSSQNSPLVLSNKKGNFVALSTVSSTPTYLKRWDKNNVQTAINNIGNFYHAINTKEW